MSGIVKLSLNVFGQGVCELPTSTVGFKKAPVKSAAGKLS
jgi:hypothetical protein